MQMEAESRAATVKGTFYPNSKVAQMIRKIEGCFRADVRLSPSQSSTCDTYAYEGVVKGHMVPAGEFDIHYSVM